MIWFLLVLIIFLGIISLILNKGDFFSPSCIICLSYLFSTFCAILNIKKWGVSLHYNTLFVIVIGLATFIAIECISKKITVLPKNKISVQKNFFLDNSDVLFIPQTLILLISFISFLILIMLYQEISRLGGAPSISESIGNFRNATVLSSNEELQLTFSVTQLLKFSAAFGYVLLYFYINNSVIDKKNFKKISYLIPITIHVLQSLLTGGRLPLIRVIVSIVLMYYILHNLKNGWRISTGFTFLRRTIVTVLLFFIVFYFLKDFLGRSSQESFIDYITRYVGGSIEALDIFLNTSSARANNLFGQETFSGVYAMFSRFSSDNIDIVKSLPWVVSRTGYTIGNVYTAFRRYYSDFGYLGVIFCTGFISFVYSKVYSIIKMNLANNYKKFSVVIFLYTSFVYPLVTHAMEDIFYITLITIGTMIQFVLFIGVYIIMIKISEKYFIA
ncbi:O-antigen polymerase [Candidatus Enterococcus murrayae]|uniref:Oligosaccharide repeat unit polymerase n=1 Tax=Candidatus Enterococcus murrayae TaxID=2815321 RepID=A0ABS3HGK2_9ENTE|nr:O-antigen polymerase [Enterococcus sp. MJM16]MBO0452040.1 oligosaccharide repeat unit polymerase [Enterococcus sp. MJM16]